jgi:tRNA modification GTPase
VHLDLAGLPVTLLDTAGIRETADPVEQEGVTRARARAASADLVLWVVDANEPALPDWAEIGRSTAMTWLIRNKIDIFQDVNVRNEPVSQNKEKNEHKYFPIKPLKNMANEKLTGKDELRFSKNEHVFNISAVTGEGYDVLLARLAQHAEGYLAGGESALVTRERHRRALEDVQGALRRALARDLAGREDLLAEELRIAGRAVGRLTGRVDVEDVLDVIFRDFCIGK